MSISRAEIDEGYNDLFDQEEVFLSELKSRQQQQKLEEEEAIKLKKLREEQVNNNNNNNKSYTVHTVHFAKVCELEISALLSI